MHKMFALTVIALAALIVGFPRAAVAQLRTAQQGPVVYGHHHINARDPAEHQRFWVDTLGGRPVTLGEGDAIVFPNVVLLLTPAKPTGGTQGSSVDHLAFQVQNLAAVLNKVRLGGYRILTKAELTTPNAKEIDSFAVNGLAAVGLAVDGVAVDGVAVDGVAVDGLAVKAPAVAGTQVAYVVGPDDTTIELVEVPGSPDPIALDHVHFFTPEPSAMQAWYAKVFGAKTRNDTTVSATLPGVSLIFTQSERPVAGTKGRALDHIGLEVKDLASFTKKLETMGVKLDLPYRKVERAGLAIAFLTDPWGTRIELTEGMAAVQ